MTRPRRGGVLLETLLAIALFVFAATFVIGASRSALTSARRATAEGTATDLAASKMAELEAGLISVRDLAGGDPFSMIGSVEYDRGVERGPDEDWILTADSERTEWAGLTLVTLTVTERESRDPRQPPVEVTVRRILNLSAIGNDE